MNASAATIETMRSIDYYTGNVATPLSLCLGLVGNTLALITFMRMQLAAGAYFLIALTVSDIWVLLSWMVFWIQGRFETKLMDISEWACKLILLAFYSSIHCSVPILVAMTTERFVVVWFPLRAKTLCKKKNCLIAITVVCVTFVSLNLHNLFTRQLVGIDGNGTTSCLLSGMATSDMPHGYFHVYIWPWIDSVIYSFIPIISLFILNSLIIYRIKSSVQMAGKNSKEARSHSEQITRTLLLVSFAFLTLTSPIAVMLIVEKNWEYQADPYQLALYSVLRTVGGLTQCINHSINFCLYCLGGKQFRDAFVRLTCARCRQNRKPDPPSKQTSVSNISKSVQSIDKA